jgi:hypothetical protein
MAFFFTILHDDTTGFYDAVGLMVLGLCSGFFTTKFIDMWAYY